MLGLADSGNFNLLFFVALSVVLFWALFYLIWTGVHWVRWIVGALIMLNGFAQLIWGWRDEHPLQLLVGAIVFCMGAFLWSPSVYFFTCRQKENFRWKRLVIWSAIFLFMAANVIAARVAYSFARAQSASEACVFADEAARKIYEERDESWIAVHLTPESLRSKGPERLNHFLWSNQSQLGRLSEIYLPKGRAWAAFHLPRQWVMFAETTARAQSEVGPIDLQFSLVRRDSQWKIDSMNWIYAPSTSPR